MKVFKCSLFSALALLLSIQMAVAATSRRQVDVLFVVDNSGSMQKAQNRTIRAISSFIQQLQQDRIDFRIGVTGTDAWRAGYINNSEDAKSLRTLRTGEINFATRPYTMVTDSGVPVVNSRLANLEKVLSINLNQGSSGTGDERAFSSFQQVLTASENKTFRRPDAKLSIVIISDEDDFSTDSIRFLAGNYREETDADPVVLAPSTDPSDLYALYRDPNLISVSSFVSSLTQIAGRQRATVSAIAILDLDCKAEFNAALDGSRIGRRYIELTRATGGYLGSICAIDEALAGYAKHLRKLSQNP